MKGEQIPHGNTEYVLKPNEWSYPWGLAVNSKGHIRPDLTKYSLQHVNICHHACTVQRRHGIKSWRNSCIPTFSVYVSVCRHG